MRSIGLVMQHVKNPRHALILCRCAVLIQGVSALGYAAPLTAFVKQTAYASWQLTARCYMLARSPFAASSDEPTRRI